MVPKLGTRYIQVAGWIKEKRRQAALLAGDPDLKRAVLSRMSPPAEGSRFAPGDIIRVERMDGKCARFKIFGIQSGGFSNVHFVVDLDALKPYGLKECRALSGSEKENNARFAIESEIGLLLAFQPNLLKTEAAFSVHSRRFILTEYIPGGTLSSRLKNGPLELGNAIEYGIHLCRAMVGARDALPGFVHGDIKPANCLITDDNSLKLGDFGQASATPVNFIDCGRRFARRGDGEVIEPPNGLGGTPAYMAPELLAGASADRGRADIYAFGVTFFEMICGYRPYSDRRDRGSQGTQAASSFLEEMLAERGVPQVAELILACLADEPEERPADFSDIEAKLQGIASRLIGRAVPAAANSRGTVIDALWRTSSFTDLGRHERSQACVDQAIEEHGASADLLACKAAAMVLAGRSRDARAVSTSALDTGANTFSALLSHARVLAAEGDLKAAQRHLADALKIEPSNCAALNLMGKLSLELGEYREASRHLRHSLDLDSSHTGTLNCLARVEFAIGEVDTSIKLAKKSLNIDPRGSCAQQILGDAFYFQGRLFDAVCAYKSAMSLSAYSKETDRKFVRCCMELFISVGADFDSHILRILIRGSKLVAGAASRAAAERFLQDIAILLRVTDSNALLLLFCLDDAVMESYERADTSSSEVIVSGLETILRDYAKRPDPCFHLLYPAARIYYRTGRYDDCLRISEMLIDRFGSDERPLFYVAACYEMLGDFQSSLRYFKKAARLDNSEDNRLGVQRVSRKLKSRGNVKTSKFDLIAFFK